MFILFRKSLKLLYIQFLIAGAGDILNAATFYPNRDLNLGVERARCNVEGIIDLAACHLVNCLCFEAYPNVTTLKWYSYTVSVSLSGQHDSWFKLFDYSSFRCRGLQVLHFPTISLRYSPVRLHYYKHVLLYSQLSRSASIAKVSRALREHSCRSII